MDERLWHVMQRHLRYTDEEMQAFRDNPRNADILSKSTMLMSKTIVVEVVEAHGCNSRHQVGDKFYFDGAGNLLTKLSPKRICIHALHPVAPLIFTANELLYAGVDPNEMRFKRVDCLDVGLQCGGWGRVVMELSVQDREEP
jgi:uncharacterized repeat protein (TIGR04076 family)